MQLSSLAAYPKGTSCGDAEASPSGRSTQSAWKQCRARHARLNRVKCTVAERNAQSTSEWPKTLPRGFNGAANRGPAKAQRSGFGGERRSSGTTELLPLKAKRRMWSLRRRGAPFSSIFLHEKKDGVPEGRWKSSAVGKKRIAKDIAPGGRRSSRAASKNVKQKDYVPEGRWFSRAASKNAGSRVYFSSGSIVPFNSNALCRSIQVPHFPQGFSPPS